MSGWVWWLIAAAVFGVGEMTLTTAFWLAPFAIGAGAAALVEGVADSELGAFLAFVVVTAVILARLRPIVASRLIASTPNLRTGAAALVGSQAVVIDRISNAEQQGTVRIGSEVWTARSIDAERPIESGAHVEVVEIQGATALVME